MKSKKEKDFLPKEKSGLKPTQLIAGLTLFIVGTITGASGSYLLQNSSPEESAEFLNVRQGGFKYINPLLECEITNYKNNKTIASIEKSVQEEINLLKAENKTTEVSVYFRDLNNGPWFGVNHDKSFKPASLLKVPVMIAYLKRIQNDTALLKSTIKFTESQIKLPESAEELKPLEYNTEYTVEELLERMIVYSDNQAFRVLISFIDTKELDQVHRDLGLVVPDKSLPEDIITVKTYASLFRVLYNSSYLSRSTSEYAMELLSKSVYVKGLRKGVPDSVEIAHKFGLRINPEDSSEIQLHDCGVIYYPEKPYLLCIMTKGPDYDNLSEVIGTLSKKIYDEFTQNSNGTIKK